MKKFLQFYDSNKIYVYPSGKSATPELDFPIVNIPNIKLVIETDVDGLYFYTAPVTLKVKANEVGVDITDMTDDEALLALENKMNEPLPEPQPTAEERIASALEFQNVLAMPDVTA